MIRYEKHIEVKMQRLFVTLSEKDKRRYAAIEAEKPTFRTPIIENLNISKHTFRQATWAS